MVNHMRKFHCELLPAGISAERTVNKETNSSRKDPVAVEDYCLEMVLKGLLPLEMEMERHSRTRGGAMLHQGDLLSILCGTSRGTLQVGTICESFCVSARDHLSRNP